MGKNIFSVIKSEVMSSNMEAKFRSLEISAKSFHREAAFALQMIQNNQKLLDCPQVSILTAVYNVALTTITLNPALAYAYLVPRGGKCCLDISYKGLVYLATQNGKIRKLHANVVWNCDRFKLVEGSCPEIMHEPDPYRPKTAARVGAYAVATFPDNSTQHCWMTIEDIKAVQKKSMMTSGGPWKDFTDEMWKKTVIKRLAKLLGRDDNFAKAIQVLNEHEGIEFTERQLKPEVDMPKSLPGATEEDVMDQQPDPSESVADENMDNQTRIHLDGWIEKLTEPVFKAKILSDKMFKKKDWKKFGIDEMEAAIQLCINYEKGN